MKVQNFLYIGADYSIGPVSQDDGSAWASTPCAVLYNDEHNIHIAADVAELTDPSNIVFGFSAALTATLRPGSYHLEIYSDSDMTFMLHYKRDYTAAVRVAATPV